MVISIDPRDAHESGRFKDLCQEVKELSTMVQRLAYEIHRVTEKDDHEREKLQLKLDNQLLRFERRLTPKARNENLRN